jgi:hypothetical protein
MSTSLRDENGDPSHPANTEWPEHVIIRRALHAYMPITDATYNRCVAYLNALLDADTARRRPGEVSGAARNNSTGESNG